jgi:hypothetical protein
MRIRFLILAVLAGCFGAAPHVPTMSVGSVPLTVVNASNRDIWAMAMWPDDQPMNVENWLGAGMRSATIKNGDQRVFMVKPGSYRVAFLVTDAFGQHNTRYVAGTLAKAAPQAKPPVQVAGATTFKVGTVPLPNVAPDAVTMPLIDLYGTVKQDCKPDGDAAGDASECCSLLLTDHGTCSATND